MGFLFAQRSGQRRALVTVQTDAPANTADLEPISTAASPDALQHIMDTARAGAQAQAELEAQGIDPESPAEEDEDTENPEDAGDESEQEPQAEHPDDSAAAEDEPSPDERSPQEQETRSERRQRALQRVTGELEQIKARAQALEGQLHQVRASDSNVINAIQQQAGSEQEFQQLRDTVRRTPEQQQRYEVMVEWRKVAGPIYRTAVDQAYAGLADAIT